MIGYTRAGVACTLMMPMILCGCATSTGNPGLPRGEAAYAIIPPADPVAPRTPYLIAAEDVLNVQVFLEPDLSSPNVQVDDSGNIQMPLVGELPAAGLSAAQVAANIAARLRQRYIVDPQVVVSVAKGATRLVTVEGQVTKPGVYEVDLGATLLSAIARAEGTTKVAKLDDVAIFRTFGGKRLAARFNLADVRGGVAADPRIIAGDVVVVGYSPSKGAFFNLLQSAPLFNVFYLLR